MLLALAHNRALKNLLLVVQQQLTLLVCKILNQLCGINVKVFFKKAAFSVFLI